MNANPARLLERFESLAITSWRALEGFRVDGGGFCHHTTDRTLAFKTTQRAFNAEQALRFQIAPDGNAGTLAVAARSLLNDYKVPVFKTSGRGLLDSLMCLTTLASEPGSPRLGDELLAAIDLMRAGDWNRRQVKPNEAGVDLPHTLFANLTWRCLQALPAGTVIPERGTYCRELQRRCADEAYKQLALNAAKSPTFDVAQLAFSIEPASEELPASLINSCVEACAKEIMLHPGQRLHPFHSRGRDYSVTPRPEEVVTAVLQAAIRIAKRRLSLTSLDDALVETLAVMLDRLEVSMLVRADATADGWPSFYDDNRAESWPTLAVAEMSGWAIKYLRLTLLLKVCADYGLIVERPNRGVRKWATYAGLPFQAHKLISERFIPQSRSGWASAVLFGPPGTGKTTMVRSLAQENGWLFVVLTPADLAQDGPDQIIFRARQIIERLSLTEECVILLDEFDPFMLRRDNEAESNALWSSLITNCMLPLLAGLRHRKQALFFVATNYVNRMDAAAIRPGRFDAIVPIWPPTYESRAAYIKEHRPDLDGDRVAEFARATKWATYDELQHMCEGTLRDREASAARSGYDEHLKYARPSVDVGVFS